MTNLGEPSAAATTTGAGEEPAAARDARTVAKRRTGERLASNYERSIDNALYMAAPTYLVALVLRDDELAAVALTLWTVAVLTWSHWIPVRVGRRSPPGDRPLAMARTGVGLLGLPLSILVLVVAPEGGRALFAFPVAFAWCGAFMISGLSTAPARLRARRRMLDLGVVAYLGQAVLAGAGSVVLVTQEAWLHPSVAPYAYLLALGCAALAVVLALVGLRLAGDAQAPPQPHWIAEGAGAPAMAETRSPPDATP